MAKKKKREISKRRAKSREKTRRKRKLRLAKAREAEIRTIERPGLPHMGAPEGFRSISMSQAIMEYAKPLFDYTGDDENDLNENMQVGMLLWNYAVSINEGRQDNKIEKKILKSLSAAYGLKKDEASALLSKMVDRYAHLFPKEIQPKPAGPFMFIRKEIRYLIKPFDSQRLVISDEVIPADKEDRELVEKIETLDSHIENGADYALFENLVLSLHDPCREQFEKWLTAKGLEENVQNFSFCLQTYIDFIYAYGHDDPIVLKSMLDDYFLEFFEDFLLRKMMVEPMEYVYWPPALKLFYRFLYEKRYLDNPENTIQKIDKMESYFIKVLKKQFS